jgi:glycosyltransferase involved in cell wall biosynthesis
MWGKLELKFNYDKLMQEELAKQHNDVNFFDQFEFPQLTLSVSVVIPTYNRCPFDPHTDKGKFNPLFWSIQSALKQKIKVKEIIIVNDGSDDYTDEVVKYFEDNIEHPRIIHIKNEKKSGSSISRNNAAKRATARYLLFMDDDLFLSPYTAFGAVYTFEKLRRRGHRVGALVLPYYFRATQPRDIKSKKYIGQIYFAKGLNYGYWNSYPTNYLAAKRRYIDDKYKLLYPLHVNNCCGYVLCSKKAYESVGGFPEHFNWKNHYGEETEFACRLTENGYSIFFTPDIKLHAYHGQFGLNAEKGFLGKDWAGSLKEISESCNAKRENTGNRVAPDDWYYCKIISYFVILYRRNKDGAMSWIKYTYKEFVRKNSKLFRGNIKPIEKKADRRKIWENAIKDGLNLIINQEKSLSEEFLEFIKTV